MAEPVGITGTAVGLVSMGLQLYSEISKYINAVKGRERDLEVARRQAETLQKCLAAIDEATSSTNITSTASNDAVETCVIACKNELQGLKDLVTRLRGPTTPAGTLSAKAREKGRELIYPFRKENVVELEKTLASTNEVLQTALQTLGLNISATIQGTMAGLQSNIAAIKVSTENSDKQIAALSTSVEDIHTIVSGSNHLIPEIHVQAAETSLLVARQTEYLSQTSQMSIRVEENTRVIQEQVDRRMERLEELFEQLVASSSAGPRNTKQKFGQLLARPSDLRILCDGLISTESTGRSASSFDDTRNLSKPRKMSMAYDRCPCMKRRYTRRHHRSFGPLALETEISEIQYHNPECPFSQLTPSDKNARRGFSISIPGLQGLLKKAIKLSLALNTGAGGSTFSQSLSWVAVVDREASPVFRLADILSRAMAAFAFADDELEVILESCWKRIFWCYTKKLASPTDIDDEDTTLLGSIVGSLQYKKYQSLNLACFIQSLMALRLSINNVTSIDEDEPIYAIILKSRWLRDQEAVQIFIDALRESDDPVKEYDVWGLGSPDSLENRMEVYKLLQNFTDLADELRFSPLMKSILCDDLEAVTNLLDRNPSSVFEQDSCGQTPIHMAVLSGNVSMLQTILSVSNAEQINTTDSSGYRPIDYTLYSKVHDSCRVHPNPCCKGCNMLEALLKAGSGLFHDTLEMGLGHIGFNRMDERAQVISLPVRRLILRYLREKRTKLSRLGKESLPKSQLRNLSYPKSSVLDRKAAELQFLLEEQSVQVPLYLRVYTEHDYLRDSKYEKSVYAYICDKDTAQFAWELGFLEIEHNLQDGLFQIVSSAGNATSDEQVNQGIVDYVSWLVERGLRLDCPITADFLSILHVAYRSPSYMQLRATGAHYFMKFLGSNAPYIDYGPNRSWRKLNVPKELLDILFSQRIADQCSCWCSLAGCTPLTKFFEKRRGLIYQAREETIRQLSLMCQLMITLIPQGEQQETRFSWVYQAALRFITFGALGLRHTCCKIETWHDCLDEAEIEEIHLEERDRLLLLDRLCVEFETECRSNARLARFVQDTWSPRMLAEMEVLDSQKLTAQERLAAVEIGVIWDSDSDSESEDDPDLVKIFMGKLDKVIKEPSMQLPYGQKLN